MSETSSARIAFVGAGNHATESLYPNIAHIPEFELVAVCDLDGGRAASAARRFGAAASFTDLDRMLRQEAPDGVCVCGHPQMHYEVGLHCLGRGLPVFVEKPPAPDYVKAVDLVDAANRNQTFGMVGFMKRFAPANIVAREFMQSDLFGRLSSITLIHGSGPYNEIRRMLYFNGIHMLDLGRFLAGDVASVFAYGFSEETQAVSVAIRFRTGAVGQFNVNSGHSWTDCFEQVYVSGNCAGIMIDASRAVEVMSPGGRFADGEGLKLYGWSNRYYVSGNMAGWASSGHCTRGYWGELKRFAQSILGEAQPTPTLNDGAEALKLIEAILKSMSSGTPVAL